MKKKNGSKVSLGDVAKKAGVCKATASVALHNRAGVSVTTRKRILRLAQRLGYVPDARIASWMARVQDARTKDLLPIGWLNTHSERNAWHKFKFLSPYLEGARERCLQLGYRLEEIWLHEPGTTMRRVSEIVYQRGIGAVIVTQFAKHLRFNWDHLAAVSLEGALLAPRLNRVATDIGFNLTLALKMVRRFGYRRIGICLDQNVDRNSSHSCRAEANYLHAVTPKSERVPPLLYSWETRTTEEREKGKAQVVAWLRRYQPDVIVGHSNQLVLWAQAAGYRVPEEIGIVHIANDDDVSDWAGICSNRREIGAAAVNQVISLAQIHQFGVPKIAMHTLIRGSWRPGRTLLMPKPK
jgi:LacI family transcriptional regulator